MTGAMLILTLRGLWPLVGAGLSVLIPLAMGWPLWVALLVLVPALWVARLVLTWLAIAALRGGTSAHARDLVPDLESLGWPSHRRGRRESGSNGISGAVAAVAELVQVIERFGAEDLGALAFARSHAGAADYAATRKAILTSVVGGLRSSASFEQHVADSHAAVAAVRAAVGRAIDRIPDLQPSKEFEDQIMDHASDLARYVVLRPHLSAAEYEALWAPYAAIVPELAAAAGVPVVSAPGESAASTQVGLPGLEHAPSKAPTIEEIEQHVLFVLAYRMRVDEPEPERSLRDDYGLDDGEMDHLIDQAFARWLVQPLMRRPTSIRAEDLERADTVSDVVALIAASYGHRVAPKFMRSTTTDRFGPQTHAVFEVLREARSLPLHAGDAFNRRYRSLGDPEIRLMRKAMAEAMWAARRSGRAKQVKEARRLADRAANRSVMDVHPDNLSYDAMEQGSAAGQFAIMAVMAAATRDVITPRTYRYLTKLWKGVASN